jgi:hypothetical protein
MATRRRVKWTPIPDKEKLGKYKYWITCGYCGADREAHNIGEVLDHGKGICEKKGAKP